MRVRTVVPALVCVGLPLALGGSWLRASGVAAPTDDALLSALGCGGCHAGLPAPVAARAAAPPLGPDAPPLSGDFVFEYLGDPAVRRPEIAPARMPDFDLSEPERAALALFLGGGRPGPALAAAVARYPDADAAAGRSLFGAFGCGSCHGHADAPAPSGSAPSLAGAADRLRPEWVRDWLADPVPVRPAHLGGGRMPDFRLTEAELDAVTAALTGGDVRGADAARAVPGWVADGVPEVRAARAERLLETRYACRGCHVVAGRGGALGPPLDGVAERLQAGFVVEMIADPAAAAPGSAMPRQPLPRREAEILAAYLLGIEGPWRGAEPDAPGRVPATIGGHAVGSVAPGDDGAALYATWCAACHGPTGAGDGWNAAALPVPPTAHADAAVLSPRPDDVLYDGIHGGGWVLGRSPLMPAFGASLTPEQIDTLVAHLRTLCDCEGPAWSRDGGGR